MGLPGNIPIVVQHYYWFVHFPYSGVAFIPVLIAPITVVPNSFKIIYLLGICRRFPPAVGSVKCSEVQTMALVQLFFYGSKKGVCVIQTSVHKTFVAKTPGQKHRIGPPAWKQPTVV